MNMQQYLPAAILQPYIKAYLLIESEAGMTNHILPDTNLVMTFRYKGNVTWSEANGQHSVPAIALSGIRKTTRIIQYEKNTANFLVIFREAGAAAFFDLPLHELSDLSITAGQLLTAGRVNKVEDKLAAATDDRQRIRAVEQFLLSLLKQQQPDLVVQEAIHKIRLSGGNIVIKELLSALPVSRDPFEKRFRKLTGTSPKQFAGIIRLRNVIHNYSPAQTLTSIAHNAGYFDQAHFIKDFRSFTGKTPHDFFTSSIYW